MLRFGVEKCAVSGSPKTRTHGRLRQYKCNNTMSGTSFEQLMQLVFFHQRTLVWGLTAIDCYSNWLKAYLFSNPQVTTAVKTLWSISEVTLRSRPQGRQPCAYLCRQHVANVTYVEKQTIIFENIGERLHGGRVHQTTRSVQGDVQ